MEAIYISANSFKVMGDETANFIVRRRVKLDCGLDGIKYATIVSSSYSSPYTTVVIDESDLTASLTDAWYSVLTSGAMGGLPDHTHDGSEGSGGVVGGQAPVFNFIDLDDTPATYSGSEGLYLRVDPTASGVEFSFVSTSGTDDHSHAAYVPWDFGSGTISGTGSIYAGVYYGDGSNLEGVSSSGTDDHTHIAYVPWDFGSGTISGTGDIYCNDIYTSAGTVYIGDAQISAPSGNIEIKSNTVNGTMVLSGLGTTTDYPTYIEDTNGIYSSVSQFVCDKPTSTQEDDLLICHFAYEYTNGNNIVNSVPTDWILIHSQASGNNTRQLVYYKIATASEPSNYTWGFSAGSNLDCIGAITLVRNADTANPIGNVSLNTGGGNPFRGTSINLVYENELVFHLAHQRYGTTHTPAAEYTEIYDIKNGSGSFNLTTIGSYKSYTTTGATGNIDITALDATNQWVVSMISIRPFTSGSPKKFIEGDPVGATKIYHAGGLAAETTATSGINVTNEVTAVTYYGDGSNLTGIATGSGTSDVQSFLDLNDTPSAYDDGKYLISTTSGIDFVATSTAAHTFVETDYEALELVAEYSFSSETIDVTLSGIQGDTSDRWVIESYYRASNSGNSALSLQFNGDTASNYTSSYLGEASGAFAGSSETSETSIVAGYAYDSNDGASRSELYLKSGQRRVMASEQKRYAVVASEIKNVNLTGSWINIVDEVSSMRLFLTNPATGYVRVYKRANVSLPIYEPNYIDTNLYTMELVKEWNITNSGIDQTFTWDGDVDDYVEFQVMNMEVPPTSNIKLRFNNDTGSNYLYQYTSQDGSTFTANTASSQTYALITNSYNDLESSITKCFLKNNGQERALYSERVTQRTDNTDSWHIGHTGQIWQNSADKVTSITVYSDNTDITGTLRMYKRVNLQLPTAAHTTITGSYFRGAQSLYTEYKDGTSGQAIYINPGVIDINNTLYVLQDRTTLSGSFSGLSTQWSYVYATSSGGALDFYFSSAEPTMDYNKLGFYNSGDRCIDALWVGTNSLSRWHHSGSKHQLDGGEYTGLYDLNITGTSGWQEVTSSAPFPHSIVWYESRMNYTSTADHDNYRTIGATSNGFRCNSVHASSQYSRNFFSIPVNADKKFEAKIEFADAALMLRFQGYEYPEYIYTGPGIFGNITISGSGGGGGTSDVQSFLDLTDTPTSYSNTDGLYAYSTGSGIAFGGSMGQASVFEAYDSADLTGITTTAVTVPIDTVRKNSDADVFSFDAVNSTLTVNKAGTYEVTFRCSTNNSSATDSRSNSQAWLELNSGTGYATVSGSYGHMYNRISTPGRNSCTVSVVLDLDIADILRVRVQRTDGSNPLNTIAEGNGLLVKEIAGVKGDKGETGESAITWYHGNSPTNDLGDTNDFYLRESDKSIHLKVSDWADSSPAYNSIHNLGSNYEGAAGFTTVNSPTDNADYYTFDGINQGLRRGSDWGNESALDARVKFRCHDKDKGTDHQILWKSGGFNNGIALGIDTSGNLGVFAVAGDSGSSLSFTSSQYSNNVWYYLYMTTTGAIALVEVDTGNFISKTGTFTATNGSNVECIGFDYDGSSMTPGVDSGGNDQYFDGDVDFVEFYTEGTLDIPTTSGLGSWELQGYLSSTTISGMYIKGVQSIKVDYKSDAEYYINPGVVEVNGVLYENESRVTVSGSYAADTWYYVYASGDGTNLSLSRSTSVPTMDYTKMGYYSGSDRCIGMFLTDSNADIWRYKIEGGKYLYFETVVERSLASLTGVEDVTFDVPFGNLIVTAHVMVDDAGGSQLDILYPGTTGAANTRTTGLAFGRGGDEEMVIIDCEVDSSKQIRFWSHASFSNTTSDGFKVEAAGFQMPDYIYSPAGFSQLEGGGGGTSDVQSFLDLTDTPASYSGTDGQFMVSTGSGIEFSPYSINSVQTDYVADELIQTWNVTNSGIDETITWDGELEDLVIEFAFEKDNTVASWLVVYPNGDTTTANYGLVQTGVNTTPATTLAYQDPSSVEGLLAGGTGSTSQEQFHGLFRASLKKSAAPRVAYTTYYRSDANRWLQYQTYWKDTSNDVTSIRVYMEGNNTGWVRLYKRAKMVLPVTDSAESTFHAYELVGSYTFNNEAMNNTLSGIQGDTHNNYYVEGYLVDNSGAGNYWQVRLNNDSGTNYNVNYYGVSSGASGGYSGGATGETGCRLGYASSVDQGGMFRTRFYLKSGEERFSHSTLDRTQNSAYEYSSLWTNTADEVTSFTLNSTGAVTGYVKIYRFGTVSVPITAASVSGTDDHSHAAYVPWDFGSGTISGTGDIYCNDIFTSSGTVYIGDLQLTTDGTNLLVNNEYAASPMVTMASGEPSSTPYREGDIHINLLNDGLYQTVDVGYVQETEKYNTTLMTHTEANHLNSAGGGLEVVSDGISTNYSQQSGGSNIWYKIDFGAGNETGVYKLLLRGLNGTDTRMPNSFRVEASNNDSDWDIIYTDNAAASSSTVQEFNFGSISNPYRYWRLYIVSNHGDSLTVLTRIEYFAGYTAGNYEWQQQGSLGSTTFSGLTDTPADYGTQGDYLVSTGSGIEFTSVVPGSTTGARVYRSTTQTLTNGVYVPLSWDTEVVDDEGYWDISNPTRLTAPSDGWYVFTAGFNTSAAPTSVRTKWQVNGTRILDFNRIAGTDSNDARSSSSVEYLNAGDYVEFLAFSQDGSASTNAATAADYSANTGAIARVNGPTIPVVKGKQSISIPEHTTASGIYINPGEIHMKNSTFNMYTLDDQIAIYDDTLSVSTWYYIYATVSGSTATLDSSNFYLDSTEPTVDYPNMGYYNGNDRCIGAIRTDSLGDYVGFRSTRGDVLFVFHMTALDSTDIDTSWVTVPWDLPSFVRFVHADFQLPAYGVNGSLYYREKGATTTNGYEVLDANTSGRVDHNQVLVCCDTNQEGEIKFTVDGNNEAQVRQFGYVLPDYIYTGA